jgi:hypothetical protein
MHRRISMFVVLALVVAGCQRVSGLNFSTTAKVMRDEPVAKSFKTSATPKVIVEVFAGSITVTRGDEATVDAEVTKRGGGETETEALEMLKKLDLKMEQEGDAVRIVAKTPPGERYIGEAPAKLKVPAGASLELRTSFNDVSVTGINGTIDAKSSNGGLTIREGSGDLKLNTSFGKIDVDAPAAGVQATTSNGDITIKKAKGPLTLKSSFGAIRIEPAGGDVTAETSNGDIQIHGDVERVLARSSFGNIEIYGATSAVNAETSNGTISFNGSLADSENIFKTSFGHVALTLPVDAQFSLDAKTSFGAIRTGFTLATTGSSSKTHLTGTVGANPKTTLKLTTSNGNIVVNPGK